MKRRGIKNSDRLVSVVAALGVLFLGGPMRAFAEPMTQTGTAACASKHLIGHKTASGEKYDPDKLTCASAHFPLGSTVKVTNLANGKEATLLVNDKMSRRSRRIIMDVSTAACHELGSPKGGKMKVRIEKQ